MDNPSVNNALITGITGNVGLYAAQELHRQGYQVTGAVTSPEHARQKLGEAYRLVRFDFREPATYAEALDGVDRIFLMRPPALSDPGQLAPFVAAAKARGVRHVVFLSLLGIEKNPFPPHAKIEKLLAASGMAYTFLRPSFFMQNLTGPHLEDIRDRNDVFVPAGRAPVSFIDTRDIGEAVARILMNPDSHANRAYDLTGGEAITYHQAAAILTEVLERPITYSNPSTFRFRREKLRQGVDRSYVTVMCGLYLMTKLGMAKRVTGELERILGRRPNTFGAFARDHASCWLPKRGEC
ncbi:SDR family oxidoreductase [Gorillibacterium sp. sgz5001074]|uniref:SDR family oxidoreductase n=1 Tax=Gorillibacterium sp. sgz5001074 TaxID=3446695 RepID=UPI003F66C1FC